MSYYLKRLLFPIIVISLISVLSSCGDEGSSGGGSAEKTVSDSPGGLTATSGIYPDKINVKWSAVENAESYNVYRSETPIEEDDEFHLIDSVSGTEYDDNQIERLGKFYYYRVAGVSENGTEGPLSNPGMGYADNKPEISNINASDNRTDKVVVSWDSDGHSEEYQVLRSDSESGNFEKITKRSGGSTSFDDKSIQQGKPYYYKVIGVSKHDTEGESGTTIGYSLLNTPADVQATQGEGKNNIIISWGISDNTDYYRIYRSLNEDAGYVEIGTSVDNEFNDSGSVVTDKPGVSFYYKISAISPYSIESERSGFAEGWISVDRPSNMNASDGVFYERVELSWTGVTEAAYYKIYRSGGYIDSTENTDFSDSSGLSGEAYSYQVSAVVNGRESDKSETVTGSLKGSDILTVYEISWEPNKEKSVNRPGGGYRVFYSQTQNFNISGASYLEVPYQSGNDLTHFSAQLEFDSGDVGTWYIQVVGYSNMDNSLSDPSEEISLIVE